MLVTVPGTGETPHWDRPEEVERIPVNASCLTGILRWWCIGGHASAYVRDTHAMSPQSWSLMVTIAGG
jgi:hypothetical protein